MVQIKKRQISSLLVCICLVALYPTIINVQGTSETTDAENPGKRHGHGLVFVEQSKSIFLFGGRRSNGDISQLNNVWKYDVLNGDWSVIETNNTPSARFCHSMVYIPTINSIFMYGGLNNTDSVGFTDSWILNLTSLEWKKIITAERPQMKSDCGITYDSRNDCVLLFGGFQGGIRSNQLWKFNVTTANWKLISTTNSPTGRYGVGFVFNLENNQTYLFGGREFTIKSEFYKLTAELDSWELVQTENTPYHRYWHSMVYANTTNEIIVFGGQSGIGDREMLEDTWIYSFARENWIEVTKRKAPVARILSPMVFVPNFNKAYMYGGMANDYEQVFEDFWEFDCLSYKWIEASEKQIIIPVNAITLSICIGIALSILQMEYNRQRNRKK